MQTKIKEIKVNPFEYQDQGYINYMMKETQALGVDEQYSLNISDFDDEEEEIKRIFETFFMKQKSNLISMNL